MNYDLYFAQIDLVYKEGDTIQFKRTKKLKQISIGDHVFLHDYKIGYIEIIQPLPVSLGALNVMTTEHMQYVSGNIAGTTYGMDKRGTPSVYDRYYRKREHYFFIDEDHKVYNPTGAAIHKLFRANKHEIDAFLGENPVDFRNKNDLLKLLRFCHKAAHNP